MKRREYSLYRRKTKSGQVWYVRLWDYRARRWFMTRSTGVAVHGLRGRRQQADDAAREIASAYGGTGESATVLDFLRRMYAEGSPYVLEYNYTHRVSMSAVHIKVQNLFVKNHLASYGAFGRMPMQDLTRAAVKDCMAYLAETGRSVNLVNKCLNTLKAGAHYAMSCGLLKDDPCLQVHPWEYRRPEKGVFSREEVKRVEEAEMPGETKAPFLLGALCGLRLGEVRGLQWEDVSDGVITVRHNWQDGEGLKEPKCGSVRKVPVVGKLSEILSGGEGFVLKGKGGPLSGNALRYRFNLCMDAVGIGAEDRRKRNLTFHSLRHTFITLGQKAGLSEAEMASLAGHRSLRTTGAYTHMAQVSDLGEIASRLEGSVAPESH